VLKEALVRIGGWRAPILFGGPSDFDRWRWLAAHADTGSVRTLDAGSGLGAFSFHAAKQGNEVVAISFVPKNNEKARKRARILGFDKTTFIDGDLRQLDELSSSLGLFDQIFCIEVIEHVMNDAKLVRDLSRLLKPGGKLLLSTPYKFHRRLKDEWISEVEDGRHVRFGYTFEEIRELLAAYELAVVKQDFIAGFVTQQVDNVMRAIRGLTPQDRTLSWIATFPLRALQIFDRPLSALTRWPYLSVAVVAVKRGPLQSRACVREQSKRLPENRDKWKEPATLR
jgi:2-polyprenyl-3-methyl-5-hydroxy-6-metoxy-1,4-benzoquinol methylase